jgi:hypothetical protein
MNMRFKELGIQIATPVQTVIQRPAHEDAKTMSREDAPPPAGTLRESPPPAALGNSS